MSLIQHFYWSAWGADIANPSCQMVAYNIDPDHVPPKWQEDLYGQEAIDAFNIVDEDRKKAELTGDYHDHLVNMEQRRYIRVSNETCNAWETMLDASGKPLPDPCPPKVEAPASAGKAPTLSVSRPVMWAKKTAKKKKEELLFEQNWPPQD